MSVFKACRMAVALAVVIAWAGRVLGTEYIHELVSTQVGGNGHSMAVTDAGYARILYQDWPTGSLRYAAATAVGWNIEALPFSGELFQGSLALGPGGQPHLCFVDPNDGNLRYATLQDDAWQGQIIAHVGTSQGVHMQLDPLGRPTVAFQDTSVTGAYGTSSPVLQYGYLDSGSWNLDIVDFAGVEIPGEGNYYVPGYAGKNVEFAIDAAGVPHIVYGYHQLDITSKDFRYATFEGGDWHIETIADNVDPALSPEVTDAISSIAVDGNDVPHICFQYKLPDDFPRTLPRLMYYSFLTDAGWSPHTDSMGVPHAYLTHRTENAMFVDSQGRVQIAYVRHNYGVGDGYVYRFLKEEAGWTEEHVTEEYVGGCPWSSLGFALDAQDTEHYTFVNWNGELIYTTVIPEPAALAVLAVGGLAVLRRRR